MAGEWKRTSLREAGVTLIDCDHRTPPAADSGYPYVAIPQLKEGRLALADARRILPEHFADWTRKAKPQHHDVILSRRCNPGETAFVPAGLECALGQNLVLLRSDGTKVFPPFLRWLLNGPDWWEQVGTFINVGAIFNSLKCADIPNFKMRLPPLAEQNAIAAVLGALDDKIELNRRMNATLEAMARALFQSWFVDFDPVRAKLDGRQPVGMDAATAALFTDSFQDSDAGHIPKGWTVHTLSSLTRFLSRGIGPSYLEQGGICVLNQKCVRDHRVDFSKSRRHDAVKKPINDRALQLHDVLVNSTGMGTLGRVAQVFHLPEVAIVDSHVTIVRPAADTDPFFLGINLTGREAEIEELGEGSTGQTELSRTRLGELKIITPPFDLQKAFGAAVGPLLMRIAENETQSRTLATLRDTLLPKLLSGELSVAEVQERSQS
jgi:type I restriction enzyme S subunit